MLKTRVNPAAIAAAADQCRIFLVGDHARGTPKLMERHVLELQSNLRRDNLATGQYGDILQHRLAPIAEAGRLHRTHLELALLRCIDAVAREEAGCEGDEKTGILILKRALEAPARQIAENSAVDGGVVVARMLASQGNFGFDAARKEYVDLVEAGIVDPTKVVRTALENAVSVASVLLLTEATMTEIPEAKRERATEPEMAM